MFQNARNRVSSTIWYILLFKQSKYQSSYTNAPRAHNQIYRADISSCLTFMGPCIVNVFFEYNQQDATLHNILFYCQCSTCFRRLLRPSSGAQKMYKQHRVYVESSNSPTLVVAASTLDIYPMLCVQFLSSSWQAENPPETCRALTVIKNVV
jgi:hypothetical protein